MSLGKLAGIVMIAFGCALPVVVRIGSHVVLTMDAAKGGPPNQGAMIIAFFSLVASFGIGILLILIGAFVIARSIWKRRATASTSAETRV